MRIEIPVTKPREDSEFGAIVSKGYGDPHGTIALDEKWELVLDHVSAEDCDGLIKAAAEVKTKVLAYRAEMAAPHGTVHVFKGKCQLCGKPADDELHAELHAEPEPAPVPCASTSPVTGGRCTRTGEHTRHGDDINVWDWDNEPASVTA